MDERAGARRVAVVAHHFQWWPSVVTVLDENWTRKGTFVHAGWIESVSWLSPDRLLAAGFSNERDGGMVALLDANALDGQSPAAPGSPFGCRGCGAGAPVRYVVLPRSELNRASGSPFNRARFQVHDEGIVVRTIEVPSTGAEAVDALYEFSAALDLVRASYSDRYWDTHRALEMEGKLDHPRERCPERDGPSAIDVWEPRTGWQTVAAEG